MSERARATPPESQSPTAPDPVTPPGSGADLSAVASEIRARKERSDKGKPRGPRKAAAAPDTGEISDSVLLTQLAGMLRALFRLGGIFAKWYGYEQHEELTDEEVNEGAGYFLALARKVPWLVALSVWFAGPAWILTMVTAKFRKVPPPAPRAGAPTPPPADIRNAG